MYGKKGKATIRQDKMAANDEQMGSGRREMRWCRSWSQGKRLGDLLLNGGGVMLSRCVELIGFLALIGLWEMKSTVNKISSGR
ncbi:hypothetical protein POX_c04409 [Penicillium oxalicum]|uniref:hypothetical protein n=1 Tax=Penicillium oxalicum TaxID=69781 RepID=UPI0020B84EE2|nr:hypothetical protein POX_c04409 [Penicillium oxalicum]KAI2791548.1 hypothetical protein POX_c04409 [Penicillium oxalicum]